MNFHDVATEIMLRINDEKWYETRDRIELALQRAWAAGTEQPSPLSYAAVIATHERNTPRDFYPDYLYADYRAQGDGQP